jgi:hypothetical protein
LRKRDEHEEIVPLVVLLIGINVGGHRTFRPAALAKQLKPSAQSTSAPPPWRSALLPRLSIYTPLATCTRATWTRL